MVGNCVQDALCQPADCWLWCMIEVQMHYQHEHLSVFIFYIKWLGTKWLKKAHRDVYVFPINACLCIWVCPYICMYAWVYCSSLLLTVVVPAGPVPVLGPQRCHDLLGRRRQRPWIQPAPLVLHNRFLTDSLLSPFLAPFLAGSCLSTLHCPAHMWKLLLQKTYLLFLKYI